MSEDLLLQDMLAYPKSKAQMIDPNMEIISPLAIHMNIQLQLFECPWRTVCHMHSDTSTLPATGSIQLQYSAVKKHTVYTKEGNLYQFNEVKWSTHAPDVFANTTV